MTPTTSTTTIALKKIKNTVKNNLFYSIFLFSFIVICMSFGSNNYYISRLDFLWKILNIKYCRLNLTIKDKKTCYSLYSLFMIRLV